MFNRRQRVVGKVIAPPFQLGEYRSVAADAVDERLLIQPLEHDDLSALDETDGGRVDRRGGNGRYLLPIDARDDSRDCVVFEEFIGRAECLEPRPATRT